MVGKSRFLGGLKMLSTFGIFSLLVPIVFLHMTTAKQNTIEDDSILSNTQVSCLRSSVSTFKVKLHHPFQDNYPSDLNILSSVTIHSKLVGLAARCDWILGSLETANYGNEPGQSQTVFYGDIRKRPRTIFITFDHLQSFVGNIMPCLYSHVVVILRLSTLGSFRDGFNHSIFRQIAQLANSTLVKHIFVQGNFFSGEVAKGDTFSGKQQDIYKKISKMPLGINSSAPYMNYIIDDIIYFPRKINAPILSNRTLKVLIPHDVMQNISGNCNELICEYKRVKMHSLKDYEDLGKYSYVLCSNENMVWQTLLAGAIPILVLNETRFDRIGLHLPIVRIRFTENLNNLDLKQIRNRLAPYFNKVHKRQTIVEYMLLDFWWNQIDTIINQTHSHPLQQFSGTSKVYIDLENEFVVKIGKRYKAFTPIRREICILKKLQNYDWCPKIISYGKNFVVTKWAGVPLRPHNIPKDFDSQIRRILHDLKEAGVQHNDIIKLGKRKNDIELLVNEKSHLMLVDFGWATLSSNSSSRSYSCSDVGSTKVSNFAPTWFIQKEDWKVISVVRTLAEDDNFLPYMDPHRKFGSLAVHGYHRFSFATDGRLIIEKQKEKFGSIHGVLKSLHEMHKFSTFLDIGCSAGLTSFIAKLNGYSKQIIGLDHDAEYVDVYNQIAARQNMKRIRAELFSFGDPLPLKYRSDVVFVGALIHWIFTCTAQFKNFASIFEYLYLVVGKILLIEWVDPLDEAILYFNHIESCGNQTSTIKTDDDCYTQRMFDSQLSIHFNVLDIIPLNKAKTRLLYVTETIYGKGNELNLQDGLSELERIVSNNEKASILPYDFLDRNVRSTKFKSLYTPTHVLSIRNGSSFVVTDCWHNRILWTNDLSSPIETWKVVVKNVAHPHSTAIDASESVLITEDTERSQVLIMRLHSETINFQAVVALSGARPHRSQYSNLHKCFFILCSVPAKGKNVLEMAKLVVNTAATENDTHVVHFELPFLGKAYTRSFGMFSGKFYFASGENVMVATFQGDRFAMARTIIQIPNVSLNDVYIASSGNMYITWTHRDSDGGGKGPQGSICVIKGHECHILNSLLGIRGTPYYISELPSTVLAVPEITEQSGIIAFSDTGCDENNFVCGVERLSGPFIASQEDYIRKVALPRSINTRE
jgi:SAM-dependent methyltransferase/predicted Ser/Thr protein kinase